MENKVQIKMILCLEPLPLKTNIKLSNNKTRNILLCRTEGPIGRLLLLLLLLSLLLLLLLLLQVLLSFKYGKSETLD